MKLDEKQQTMEDKKDGLCGCSQTHTHTHTPAGIASAVLIQEAEIPFSTGRAGWVTP